MGYLHGSRFEITFSALPFLRTEMFFVRQPFAHRRSGGGWLSTGGVAAACTDQQSLMAVRRLVCGERDVPDRSIAILRVSASNQSLPRLGIQSDMFKNARTASLCDVRPPPMHRLAEACLGSAAVPQLKQSGFIGGLPSACCTPEMFISTVARRRCSLDHPLQPRFSASNVAVGVEGICSSRMQWYCRCNDSAIDADVPGFGHAPK